MKQSNSLWHKSLTLHHSCLLFVLLVYICDIAYGRFIYLGLGFISFLLILPLKVYLISGIFGMLVEFISTETIVPQFHRFKTNANKYWKIFLLLQCIPLLLHFGLTVGFPNHNIAPVYAVYALLFTPIAYLFARAVIGQKYLKPLDIPSGKTKIFLNESFTLFILFVAQTFFFQLPYWLTNTPTLEWTQLTLPVFNYLNQLIFIYAAAMIIRSNPSIEEHFKTDKEIYLINPLGGGIAFHFASLFSRSYPPVFVVIKALTPKGYRFREFNALPWDQRYVAPNKLVAITCFTSNCDDAYAIAREYKEAGSTVIMGGPHVTYAPQEALEYCDCVVTGEAESVWKDVISDYESGSLKQVYNGVPLEECHELVYQELLNSPPSVIKDFLETSRGCKFKCHFCTIPSFSGGKVRTQPTFEIVTLLKKIKQKHRHVLFVDNNIYSDPAYAKELFKAIKPLNIRWSTQCTIDIAKNEETLRLAKESGCHSLLIGFEIEDDSEESKQGGKFALSSKFKDYVKRIKNHGIKIKGHFIFGFDSHSFKHLWRLWKFALTIRPTISVLSLLTPYPGSHLYHDMYNQDRITNLNWRHYGCQSLVIESKKVNNTALALSWPVIMPVFFLTTSTGGMIVSGFIAVFIWLAL